MESNLKIYYNGKLLSAINAYSFLLLLKPIVDIFYQVAILDYAIIILALLILLKNTRRIGQKKLNKLDFTIIILFALDTFTFLRNIDAQNFRPYVKIVSAYLLYIIGSIIEEKYDTCIVSLRYGFLIALFVNICAIFSGKGTIYWGSAYTIKGLYYFKTDMAVAMVSLCAILITNNVTRKIDIVLIIICTVITILTNARISYLALAIILMFGVIYKREQKQIGRGARPKEIKISLKIIIIVAIISIGIIYFIRLLGGSRFFEERGFISLQFDSISDLLSGSNTQGRIYIWNQVYNKFQMSSFLNRMIGVGFDNGIAIINNQQLSSHSLYLSVLYRIGYFGVAVYVLHVLFLISNLNNMKNRQVFYLVLMFMCIFYLFGISVPTDEYTNYSWYYMFFAGMSSGRFGDVEYSNSTNLNNGKT